MLEKKRRRKTTLQWRRKGWMRMQDVHLCLCPILFHTERGWYESNFQCSFFAQKCNLSVLLQLCLRFCCTGPTFYTTPLQLKLTWSQLWLCLRWPLKCAANKTTAARDISWKWLVMDKKLFPCVAKFAELYNITLNLYCHLDKKIYSCDKSQHDAEARQEKWKKGSFGLWSNAQLATGRQPARASKFKGRDGSRAKNSR